MLEHEKEYICTRCKYIFSVKADLEQFYVIPKPAKCPSSGECSSKKFSLLSETGKIYVTYLAKKWSLLCD
jgi:DNA helicase MCM9